MKNNKLLIIGLITLTVLIGGAFGHQVIKSNKLRAEIIQNQEKANDKIALLEKQLKAVKTPLSGVYKKDLKTPSIASPEKYEEEAVLTAEEKLLANLFEVEATPDTTTKESENQKQTGSKLSITPKILDLGVVSKANGLAAGTYTLKNDGDKPLTISYVFSSCGCTTTPLKEDKVLQPQEEFILEVTYDPNYYGPNFGLGPVEKIITVLSNDPEKPFYKVKMRASITP